MLSAASRERKFFSTCQREWTSLVNRGGLLQPPARYRRLAPAEDELDFRFAAGLDFALALGFARLAEAAGDFFLGLFADWPSFAIDLGIDFAICLALAPATPPTTAPTAAPSGLIIDPAAAPAAAPPTSPKADAELFADFVAAACFVAACFVAACLAFAMRFSLAGNCGAEISKT
jgi:hypothetical protein